MRALDPKQILLDDVIPSSTSSRLVNRNSDYDVAESSTSFRLVNRNSDYDVAGPSDNEAGTSDSYLHRSHRSHSKSGDSIDEAILLSSDDSFEKKQKNNQA
jgi:hypothetical protein